MGRWHVSTEKVAEQERPYLAALSGKDRWYKAGRLKSSGAGRESEGFDSTCEGVQDNALEGRGPALIELDLGVSARACRRRPTTPWEKYDNSNASYGCAPSGVRRGVSTRCTTGSTGVTFCGKRGGGCAATEGRRAWMESRSDASRNEAWSGFSKAYMPT